MAARSGLLLILGAAALMAGPAMAQPKPGSEPPLAAPGAEPVFANAPAGWVCSGMRCSYVKLAANSAGQTWGDCFSSWTPTHGGWRREVFCR